MAGPLLWVALTAGSGSGCFWPQDDQLLSPIPPQRNFPPRIIPTSIKPDFDYSYKPGCPSQFRVTVEDPDAADRIYHRWFVYAPSADPQVYFDGTPLNSGTKAIRDTDVTPPPQLFTVSELIQNGEHRVEVVIADGAFVGSQKDQVESRPETLPDGGTILDPSYIV